MRIPNLHLLDNRNRVEWALGLSRLLFGAMCLVNVALHLDPAYRTHFLAMFGADWVPGQPAWLVAYGHAMAALVGGIGVGLFVYASVALEALLAFSLLSGWQLHRLAWVGLVYNLWLWSTVGGLGGPYTAGATDPGTAIAYALVFALILLTHGWRPLAAFRHGPVDAPAQWKFTLARVLFGLLWAFDTWWKWQPAFLHGAGTYLAGSIAGQPHWIAVYIGFVLHVIQRVGTENFAIFAALAESALALSLLTGVLIDLAMPLGVLYSLVLWSTAEGMGGPYGAGFTGNKGDVLGTANVYAVVFLLLIAARAERLLAGRGSAR
ncbi:MULTISPECIES: hypothetical protein [Metallibacterium]|jgi:hypothetical protein|uniref:hypothetical protein n=1 Tax=Metallibacterium TaxID=1218803 RepID=UPI002604F25A|nr:MULTISPECIES: hypothetical protein [Metallibacterium]